MRPDKPIYRVRITGHGISSARALSPTTEVDLDENSVEATIDDIHEVILLKYESDSATSD